MATHRLFQSIKSIKYHILFRCRKKIFGTFYKKHNEPYSNITLSLTAPSFMSALYNFAV